MSALPAQRAGACLRRCLNAPRLLAPQTSRYTYATSTSSSAAPRRTVRSASTTTTAARSNTASGTTVRRSAPSTASSASQTPPTTVRNAAAATAPPTSAIPSSSTDSNNTATIAPTRDLEEGLQDNPLDLDPADSSRDWSRSFHGLSSERFSDAAAAALLEPIDPEDIEIKPDGIIYLPEIKYRRILNRAFGPGGWGLAPRGETIVTGKTVTREYGLVAGGRLVSIARGEQQYFDHEGIPTATEGCKSNALMRCCKDLGVASELWDPRFIREFNRKYAKKVWVEHVVTKKKKQITIRKDDEIPYPWKESKFAG
ncbi:Mitochondrial genome maintenance MGM101 [Macrophomina phaseolina MS6]|uniref:Mitochondrial genome maintenance protein MGM101 n=1 Tax=Macrophomina phaseolina (strain MS6) TaxID=1126212 RepID=K2SC99_MACPH|nr:Mitochondrial genome maintenance MGM101 [Macrophomina phaseolina MS6]